MKQLPNGFLHPSKKNEIQFIDERCGLVFPWYAKPFLDVLKTWDTKSWNVFEYGSGFSTLWYAENCNTITSVENDAVWSKGVEEYIKNAGYTNAKVLHRKADESKGYYSTIHFGGLNTPFVNSIDEEPNQQYDCIIIDGVHRNTCVPKVLNYIKSGGILIHDNFNQKSIYADGTETLELLKDYQHFSFIHQNHPNGIKDWATDYWVINR